MSQFSLSSTTTSKKTQHRHLSSLLLSGFFLFCSFVRSHPLYFSYFIFFSPYLFRLLSFLSPLFITTSLLLVALLTFSPNFVHDKSCSGAELSESKVGFVQAFVGRFRSKAEHGIEEFHQFEELEAFKIVFDTLNVHIGGNPVEVLDVEAIENCFPSNEVQAHRSPSNKASDLVVNEVQDRNLEGDLIAITKPESTQLIAEIKTLGGFLHQKQEEEEEFKDFMSEKVEKEVKPPSVKSNKVEEKKEEKFITRSGSKAMRNKILSADYDDDDAGDGSNTTTPKLTSQRHESNLWSPGSYCGSSYSSSPTFGSNLGAFGSMRKEKEWRRTLACKLFEERHNATADGGGEGMDLLWETYETDTTKVQAKSKTKKKGKKSSSSRSISEYHDVEEEDDNEELDNDDGQLCCLQALKFSAGKMNLGMGRPNLARIGKALKGIGWLHHVSRHGKKVYN